MVVSAAFDELTEVLQCLESSDAEVKNVEIGERMVGEKDEITADLTVGLPVLTGVELRDEVSVSAEEFDLQDQRIDVDLSVSIPVDDRPPERAARTSAVGPSRTRNGSDGVPSYKDPDALAAVYERYDTFPEMTEALGADVTSETVRRYMVEYDIHDPSDSRPQAHRYAASSSETEGEAESENENDNETGSADSGAAPDGSDDAVSADEADRSPTGESERDSSRTDGFAGDDGPSEDCSTDGGPAAVADADGRGASGPDASDADSDLGDTSVAELIAATDGGDGDDSLVADGFGIPKGLTVAELAAVVNESNTLYEAKERLGISQEQARRLLRQLNLIDLVTRRLGADQISVSPAEIRRRIDRGGSVSTR